MNRMTSYIRRQIAWPMVFFTLMLTGVMLVGQSLRTVDLIVNKGLSLQTLIELTALLIPGALSMILPVSLFCAVMFAFYRLWQDSELIVMSASGYSVWRKIRPALELAVVVMLISLALNVYVTPLGLRSFKSEIAEIRGDLAAVFLQDGQFTEPVSGVTVYVRERARSGELHGILVYDARRPDRAVTMMAERGALLAEGEGTKVLLVNGNRQESELFTGKGSYLSFERYVLDLGGFGGPSDSRWLKPGERFLTELLPPYRTEQDAEAASVLWTEAHKRLSSPLYALPLALIAACGLLSGEYSRRGKYMRAAIAGVVGLGLRLSELGVAGLVNSEPSLFPLLYLVPIAGAVGALFVLRPPVRKTNEPPPELAADGPQGAA
ncbi:LPS export ABC transporter permease LptF [Zavarzinia compransoris]|uniref:LPS export ABC transporter permease LptF n=1 Tax=Zavarzinia marina TaxID=2911065 RepID=UPI001F397B26|nr:LPS export ABC transporter permease LptF [Zavarzinia marina]MCF4164450.1 LPS export ABC transporter permease LptF [Zavarzinia marina]